MPTWSTAEGWLPAHPVLPRMLIGQAALSIRTSKISGQSFPVR